MIYSAHAQVVSFGQESSFVGGYQALRKGLYASRSLCDSSCCCLLCAPAGERLYVACDTEHGSLGLLFGILEASADGPLRGYSADADTLDVWSAGSSDRPWGEG